MSQALSIIVPTHNRRDALLQHLAIIGEQIAGIPETEILVVADSCGDGTEAAVERWATVSGLDLRVLSHGARNASATRNLGAQVARGQTLLFVDDDIEPLPGFVRAHFDARREGLAVLGYSKPVYPSPLSLWQKEARLWWLDVFREMSEPGYRFSYRNFFSGNVSLPRALFDKAGGFNEKLARLEDYEFGLRWLKAGGQFRYSPEACGLHRETTNLKQWLKRIRMEGEADVSTGEAHPETRPHLWSSARSANAVSAVLRELAFRFPKKGDGLAALVATAAESVSRIGLRTLSRKLARTARDYQYLRGIALRKNSREFAAWLQDGPPPGAIECDAPTLDMGRIPEDPGRILRLGSEKGLQIVYNGISVRTVPPATGSEPIRMDHVREWSHADLSGIFMPQPPSDPVQHG
jgi:glycosyltransferase involved in cell wall biosynthesis